VLLDDSDPAGDLGAANRRGELRMIALKVALDLRYHVVVRLAPCDEAALTFALPGHVVVAAIVEAGPLSYLGSSLGERLEMVVPSGCLARVQLCGRFVLELDGRRVEQKLPSRQGRLLFAFLALNRDRSPTRDDLPTRCGRMPHQRLPHPR
jgi:hypothetical protein